VSGPHERVRVKMSAGSVEAVAPAGRNRWFVILGLMFAVPWLTTFLVGSVLAVWLYDPTQRRFVLLAALWLNLLVGIIHILAVAFVWLAAFALRGEERVTLDKQRFELRRVALGVGVPFRLRRAPGDGIRVLAPNEHGPGKGPHPRLEWHSDRSALRFGSGLAAAEAEEVAAALRDFARLEVHER